MSDYFDNVSAHETQCPDCRVMVPPDSRHYRVHCLGALGRWVAAAEQRAREADAERDRLAAEVERLNQMRGAYEEAADLREAREDALAVAEEECTELRAEVARLDSAFLPLVRRAHAQFKAGRALAEAARRWLSGSNWPGASDALAAWERAEAEGGAT